MLFPAGWTSATASIAEGFGAGALGLRRGPGACPCGFRIWRSAIQPSAPELKFTCHHHESPARTGPAVRAPGDWAGWLPTTSPALGGLFQTGEGFTVCTRSPILSGAAVVWAARCAKGAAASMKADRLPRRVVLFIFNEGLIFLSIPNICARYCFLLFVACRMRLYDKENQTLKFFLKIPRHINSVETRQMP